MLVAHVQVPRALAGSLAEHPRELGPVGASDAPVRRLEWEVRVSSERACAREWPVFAQVVRARGWCGLQVFRVLLVFRVVRVVRVPGCGW